MIERVFSLMLNKNCFGITCKDPRINPSNWLAEANMMTNNQEQANMMILLVVLDL